MLETVWQSIAAGLPVFLLHFLTTIAVLVTAVWIYIRITPHHEMQLIKKGNMAAAVSLSAAILGLAIPLAFCLAGSVNTWDIILWGAVILAIQLITYFIIDRLVEGITENIEKQRMAPVLFMAAAKLSVSLINAAAIAG